MDDTSNSLITFLVFGNERKVTTAFLSLLGLAWPLNTSTWLGRINIGTFDGRLGKNDCLELLTTNRKFKI